MSGSMGTGAVSDPNTPVPLGHVENMMDWVTGQGAHASTDPNEPKRILREPPTPDEPRRKLVKRWGDTVNRDKAFHKNAFKRMRSNGAFAHGEQWQQDHRTIELKAGEDPQDQRYVANIALRHVQQRVASLYASNPRVVAKKRERMEAVVWDGDMATLAAAQAQLAQAAQAQLAQAQATGVPVVPGQTPPGAEAALAIITDFKNVQAYNKMLKRMGKTLELLWEYNVAEQTFNFKAMMKTTVRRAVVSGVAYVKLGFQRKMKINPEVERRIADMAEQLAQLERLADDLADGVVDTQSADAEQLRLMIADLSQKREIIAREGLSFDYPDSTAIIPDRNARSIQGFLGANHVTQEYLLTPHEIQKIYQVDVGKSYRAYTDGVDQGQASNNDKDSDDGKEYRALVWEIYSREDGLVYVLCEGYPDFLREPAAPEVYLDRFYPWFAIVFNEGYHEKEIFPKSDIDLLRDMQLELNRARQGLREHRRANRPKTVTSAGMLTPEDKEKVANHPANALIELSALAPGQKIEDVIMAWKGPPIDPALYDTNATFEDLLRVLGQDQAASGQTTDASATEASLAQASQHTDLSSVTDDQDTMLTELATAAGKLLLLNTSAETVQRVIGPGAVWPELTKEDVVDNLYLVVKAGSTGRPNQQKEVQNAQVIFPMLQRIPGISPEWMARELITRLDDTIDIEDAFAEGAPSMDAINRIQGTVQTPPPVDPQNPAAMQAAAAGPQAPPAPSPAPPPAGPAAPVAPPMGGAPNDPMAQGNQGAANAPGPAVPVNGLLGPRTPPMPGLNGLPPGQGGGPKIHPQGGLPTP